MSLCLGVQCGYIQHVIGINKIGWAWKVLLAMIDHLKRIVLNRSTQLVLCSSCSDRRRDSCDIAENSLTRMGICCSSNSTSRNTQQVSITYEYYKLLQLKSITACTASSIVLLGKIISSCHLKKTGFCKH